MEARGEMEAKKERGSALSLALHYFYNSRRVHGGWLLHGCPRCSVTKKNLMCASLHQGPRAARVQSDVVTAYVTFTGRVREGTVLGHMNRSSSVGYWSEDWISVSSVDVFCLDYQLLVCNWTEKRRSTGLQYVVQSHSWHYLSADIYRVHMLTNIYLFTY